MYLFITEGEKGRKRGIRGKWKMAVAQPWLLYYNAQGSFNVK